MIGTDANARFDALAAALEAMARRIAVARTQSQVLASRGDLLRWRRASLLWPIFTGG